MRLRLHESEQRTSERETERHNSLLATFPFVDSEEQIVHVHILLSDVGRFIDSNPGIERNQHHHVNPALDAILRCVVYQRRHLLLRKKRRYFFRRLDFRDSDVLGHVALTRQPFKEGVNAPGVIVDRSWRKFAGLRHFHHGFLHGDPQFVLI